MPLLVGLHSEHLERGVRALDDVVVVDLDRDAVRWSANARPVTPLPRFDIK
jgi:hypothetical protein